MMETTRIRQEGYAARICFDDFFARFRGIALPFSDGKARASKASCRAILEAAQARLTAREQRPDPRNVAAGRDILTSWRIGKTKVFLRFWHIDQLTTLTALFLPSAIKIQATVRRFLARCVFQRLVHQRRRMQEDHSTFFYQMTYQAGFTHDILLGLCDEDDRRAGVFEQEGRHRRVKTAKVGATVKQMNKMVDKSRQKVVRWWQK